MAVNGNFSILLKLDRSRSGGVRQDIGEKVKRGFKSLKVGKQMSANQRNPKTEVERL